MGEKYRLIGVAGGEYQRYDAPYCKHEKNYDHDEEGRYVIEFLFLSAVLASVVATVVATVATGLAAAGGSACFASRIVTAGLVTAAVVCSGFRGGACRLPCSEGGLFSL